MDGRGATGGQGEDVESLRRIVLGIGGNLGAREAHLAMVPHLLEGTPGIRVLARSARYVTAPVGPEQPDFLNAALLVETRLSLPEVLERAHFVEACLDRRRLEPWGPRTMDVDILCSAVSDTSGRFVWETFSQARGHHTRQLEVPHSELIRRAFALVPMADVVDGLMPKADLPELSAPQEQRVDLLGELDVQQGEDALVVGPGAPATVVDAAFSVLVPEASWASLTVSWPVDLSPSSAQPIFCGEMPSACRLEPLDGGAEEETEAARLLRTLIAGAKDAREHGRRAVGWSLTNASLASAESVDESAHRAMPLLWTVADPQSAPESHDDLLDRVREVRACVVGPDMNPSDARAHRVNAVTLMISQ